MNCRAGLSPASHTINNYMVIYNKKLLGEHMIIDDSGYCSVHKSYHCECYRPNVSEQPLKVSLSIEKAKYLKRLVDSVRSQITANQVTICGERYTTSDWIDVSLLCSVIEELIIGD